MLKVLENFAETLATNEMQQFVPQLQVNILEAVQLDASQRNEKNARIGTAVAAGVRFESTVKDHKIMWPLGKNWIDTYMAWNMVFVAGHLPLYILAKLITPATTCTASVDDGQDWIANRILSLAITVSMTVKEPKPTLTIPKDVIRNIASTKRLEVQGVFASTRSSMVATLVEHLFDQAPITNPANDAVEEMLYRLCGKFCQEGHWRVSETDPFSYMSDSQFRIYFGFACWVTLNLTGNCLEIFLWLYVLKIPWRFGGDLLNLWLLCSCSRLLGSVATRTFLLSL